MKDKLMQIVDKLPVESIAALLHHAGVDIEHELAAMDDSVQKDKSDWEQIKAQPRKHSDIASGKPKEVAVGSQKGQRSALPAYLEEQGDGMGVGGDW